MSGNVVNTVLDFDGYRLRKMKQSKCDSTDAATRKMAWIAEKYNMHQGVGMYSPSQEIGLNIPDKRLIAFESLSETLFTKQATYFLKCMEESNEDRGPDELYDIKTEMLGNHGVWGIKIVSNRISSFAEKLGGKSTRTSSLLADTVEIAFLKASYSFGGVLPALCRHTKDIAVAKILRWAMP